MWTHQSADALGENDKVFNDLLTGITDLGNDFRFDNAKAIAGEVAAGGAYKDLLQLDASDVCQVGQSGTEVRVPADPSNALGVATKQYVDALTMFQEQAETSASSGVSGTLATILNVAATKQGVVHALWILNGASSNTIRIKITVDGTIVVDHISGVIGAVDYAFLDAHMKVIDANTAIEVTDIVGSNIYIPFNSSLLIEAAQASSPAATVKVRHAIIP